MRLIALVAVALFAPCLSSAQWHTIGDVDSFSADGKNQVTLHSGTSVVQIRVLADDLVRLRFSPAGAIADDVSWAVSKTDWPAITPAITETATTVSIATGEITLLVNKRPLRISFLDHAGATITADDSLRGMSWTGAEVRVWKRMPVDEFYAGFGEKAGPLQRKWIHTTMWNSDIPGYTAATDPLYESIPFFYGFRQGRAYGIFLDNCERSSFDMGKESDRAYSFGADGHELNYYFLYGPSPSKILSRFTELVGRMPLPPRWSLGYQQCRWSYPTEGRVREIASGFRRRNIPCDVIYLDIDYMSGYRIFTWNRKNFPDPKKMIADLRGDGFRIAVIVDPGIKVDSTYEVYRSGLAGNQFVRYPDGRLYTGKVWPGVCAFPDFTAASARKWWGENFEGLVEAGVRGWWNDMNEPSVFDVPTHTIDPEVVHDGDHRANHAEVHNVYGMEMTRATYEGVRSLRPDERPFVLTRASYAGGWRYSSAWTGDNVASWEHLGMAVSMCLNLSISGQPFVGADIGGFMGYPSGELFARWLQLGVFTPLMRAHSVINERNKEPWEYGQEFTDINRETIGLRYKFLPYIYTVMENASTSGIPAMRPMLFAEPDDWRFVFEESQYEFGNDLLIAPVLDEGALLRTVVLPRGSWYDYWTGERYAGSSTVTVQAPLNHIPILVRAGSVIPTQQVVQYTDQAPIDPLTLMVYAGDSTGTSASSYYEDDGLSFKYAGGAFMRRTFTQRVAPGEASVALSPCEGTYESPSRTVVLRWIGFNRVPREIDLNNTPMRTLDAKQISSGATGWHSEASGKEILVNFPDSRSSLEVKIRF